jgi:hypothetical protein
MANYFAVSKRVRVVDDKIYPPGEDKWDEENVYHVTYPKGTLLSY